VAGVSESLFLGEGRGITSFRERMQDPDHPLKEEEGISGRTATTAVPPGAFVSQCFETVRFHELEHGRELQDSAREVMALRAMPGGVDRGENRGEHHGGIHGGEGHELSFAAAMRIGGVRLFLAGGF
jgi:hypothetical protein